MLKLMNSHVAIIGFLILVLSCSFEIVSKVDDEVLAFPGAEGFGKFTSGGRGGKVLVVDNLNDDGPGSLRDAIDQKFPRVIVFNVSGTIALESSLNIRNGDITIAGQTAPGDGICLRNYPLTVKDSNVIIRYLRVRLGDESKLQDDAFSVVRQKDVIIDHCSFSWGTDEVASCYDNENFTMQWCIISESLNNSLHQKGEHGYGGIWGGKGATFHHNLLAHHKSRLPRFCGSRYHKEPELEVVDFRNNVIYNWKSNNAYAGEKGSHNIVNNYYKAGPATDKSKRNRILNPYPPYGQFFVQGNVLLGNESITADNSLGIVADDKNATLIFDPVNVEEINQQRAEEAFSAVLSHAGAGLNRDVIDQRIVDEAKNGTAQFGVKKNGIIDSQSQVGGWPNLKTFGVKKDSDKDGMPDAWEQKNGLDPNDSSDNSTNTFDQGYTNIEIYINELTEVQ